MRRNEAVEILSKHFPELQARFGVLHLSLFGSVARDEAKPDSDVDVLAEFATPPTFDQYMGLKISLEDLLRVQVDLVTPRALKARVRPHVEREALRVA